MNPTQVQLNARLNPKRTQVKRLNPGIFRSSDPGTIFLNNNGNRLSFNLTSLLNDEQRANAGNYGAQTAQAQSILKNQYGLDFNTLPTQNLGDLMSAYQQEQVRRKHAGLSFDTGTGQFKTITDINPFLQTAPATQGEPVTLNANPITTPIVPQRTIAWTPQGYTPEQYQAILAQGQAAQRAGFSGAQIDPTQFTPDQRAIYDQYASQAQAGAPTAPNISPNAPPAPNNFNFPTNAPSSPNLDDVTKGSSTDNELLKKVLDLMVPSEDEQKTQSDIDAFNASQRAIERDIKGQPIATPFITGQLAAERQFNLDQEKLLQATLAREQAKRIASLDASKFALDYSTEREDEAQRRAEQQKQQQLARDKFNFSQQQSLLSPAEKTKGLTPYQTVQLRNQIEDNLRTNPAIKAYGELVNFGVPVILQQFDKGTADSISDTVLMRALAKVTDPTTGVREEEYRTFETAQGALNKIRIIPKSWIGRGRLTKGGREAIIREIRDRFNSRQEDYQNQYKYYQNQAQSAGVTIPPQYKASGGGQKWSGQTSSGLQFIVIPD